MIYIKKLESIFNTLMRYVVAFCLLTMLVAIFSQVVARYVFGHSLLFSEELGRYLFEAIVFFGIVLVTRERSHVSLSILYDALPRRARRAVHVFIHIVMIVYLIMLSYSGLKLTINGAEYHQLSASMQVPMQYVFIPLFLGPALSVLYLIGNLIKIYKELSVPAEEAGGNSAEAGPGKGDKA